MKIFVFKIKRIDFVKKMFKFKHKNKKLHIKKLEK